MRPVIIIPARLASTRLPEKALLKINGRSLIEWTWRAAMKAGYEVFIATDSKLIANEASRFGAAAIMTSDDCRNGTERCAEAMAALGFEYCINWQGDSPLLPFWWAARLYSELATGHAVATIRVPAQAHLGMVVAHGDHGYATGFARDNSACGADRLMHIGMYAYTASALREYCATPASAEEITEGLEQLRWAPGRVRLVDLPSPGPIRECNTAEDLPELARYLK